MTVRDISLIISLAALLCDTAAPAVTQERLQTTVGGTRRDYILAVPDSLPPGPRPLVLILHGHIGTAANTLGAGMAPSPLSAWLEIADREKVLLAALQGSKGADHRNGWRDCRSDDSDNPRTDDVAFAAGVAQSFITSGQADPRRIYVMGMSNGAMMSLRLALEMTPAPAAVAAVSGTMASHSDCRADPRPVSVLLIHGTDDPIVPFAGGEVGLGRRKSAVIGVEATRDFWLRTDGLASAVPVTLPIAHTGSDGITAVMTTYGVDQGPEVEVIVVKGGGHVEPSKRYHYGPLYSHFVGAQNRDLESAEEAWRFFRNKTS